MGILARLEFLGLPLGMEGPPRGQACPEQQGRARRCHSRGDRPGRGRWG